MGKINDLEDWILDKTFNNENRHVDISIHIKRVDVKQYVQFNVNERTSRIDEYFCNEFDKILALFNLDNYILIGTKKRPRGLRLVTSYLSMNEFQKMDSIEFIFVHHVSHAKKIKVRSRPRLEFYCVKMTVVIDIEGLDAKMEQIEERLVLIKAKSVDHAYEMVKKQAENYAAPYLNSDGRMVRWRIESYDDCYSIGIAHLSTFNNPEGIEVYSKLKRRKRKNNTVWDGK